MAKAWLGLLGLLFGIFSTAPCFAFCRQGGPTTYTLDSLVFSSPNIVIASVGHDKNSATVDLSLYGSLRPGEKVALTQGMATNLNPPLADGNRLVLFLDGERSLVGLYFVDDNNRVRRYFTDGLFCPDLASGWDLESGTEDSPDLPAILKRIDKAEKTLGLIRILWELPPTGDRAHLNVRPPDMHPADLLAFLREKCTKHPNYDFWLGTDFPGHPRNGFDRYPDKIAANLRAIDDPRLKFEAYKICPLWHIESISETDLNFLIPIFASKTQDKRDRILVANFFNAAFSGIDPDVTYSVGETRLYKDAIRIFSDQSDDAALRLLSVQLLDLNRTNLQALAKRVYSKANSYELKFAIEKEFLLKGDEQYEALRPRNGAISTLVHLCPDEGVRSAALARGKLSFCSETIEEASFFKRCVAEQTRHAESNPQDRYFVMTNIQTRTRRIFPDSYESTGSISRGQQVVWTAGSNLELDRNTDLPVGNYELSYERSCNGKVIGDSYPTALRVRSTPLGHSIEVTE